MVATGVGAGPGGGGGGGGIGGLGVDSTALVAVLDNCTTGPPTATAAGELATAGATLIDVEVGCGVWVVLSGVGAGAGAGAGVGIGVGVGVGVEVEVELEEVDVDEDEDEDEDEDDVDVETEEIGIAAVIADDTVLADLGTAVHLTPFIEVIENPAGRFALVDILSNKKRRPVATNECIESALKEICLNIGSSALQVNFIMVLYLVDDQKNGDQR